ncbi:uncharacterized protein LOC122573581 isoform X3 [Bombus pyrosoma]|uniref:uncharacterized protein LOC122573581 isoform X3 n=1 Tax=Bombus pyrosoma TaxID=396416 RepID=UPI001CB99AA9|nr:uncharacterized protein LOC122573581 isoform X3 [Bombus pyrosoma]
MRTIIYFIRILSFVTQITNVVHFFNTSVLLNQICFLTALSGLLLKEGLYIIKAAELPENYSKHSFYLSLHLHRFGNGNFQRHVSKEVAAQSEISAESIKDVVFLSSQLTHIFLLTVQGQFVQNANDEVTGSIYDALWYNSNNKTKLLFVLALRNYLNPSTLSAAGLIILNLKSFLEYVFQIIKTSVSYFTVLKST